MPLPGTKKIALFSTIAFLLIAGLLVTLHFSRDSAGLARQQLLQLLPTDATAVIFVDLDQLRASPFLARLYAWAPQPGADSEYAQFVHDTGFSYERDLKRLGVAISNHGSTTDLFAIAEGDFDRKKIARLFKSQRPVEPARQLERVSTERNREREASFLGFSWQRPHRAGRF